jgi:hypothetical protein
LRDFARQRFSGRLLAAGDLISDPYNRRELVTANGNRLMVYQMRDYNDPAFRAGDNPSPFDTLSTITLDARIVSVAIADLEGDGDNDLIVSTERSTYAIGKLQPEPFGTVSIDRTDFCSPDTVRVHWNRRVGGGDGGLKVTLKGDGDPVILEQNYMPSGDSINVATKGQLPGMYRLYLEDVDVRALRDSSAPFTIRTPSIVLGTISPGTHPGGSYHVGETVSFSTALQCLDTVHLQRQFGTGEWKNVPATLTGTGETRRIEHILECPEAASCGDSLLPFRLRLVDTGGTVQSEPGPTLLLELPSKPLTVSPGDTSHSFIRTIGWSRGDFACNRVTISYRAGSDTTWRPYGTFETDSERAAVVIPMTVGDSLIHLMVCCGEGNGTSCDYGLVEFTVNSLSDVNFVAPNPFNPNAPSSDYGDGAAIVFRLERPGTVRVTIYDLSRRVVARLRDGEERGGEEASVELWDGRNSRGEIVANGTYICVIESSSGERIVLPIIVIRR